MSQASLSAESLRRIDREIAKYPAEQKQSAVMAALIIAQDEKGWLSTETMELVAGYLGMAPVAVYEVATFYNMYNLEPAGRHKLTVCTCLPCGLQGSLDAADHLKSRLGIDFGQTTPDGRYTLTVVECLGSCGTAPMMMVNDSYHENLTYKKVDELLEGLE